MIASEKDTSLDFFSYLNNLVTNLDSFGKKVDFMIDGKKSYKTLTGGILTIFLLVFILVCFYYFGEDLTKRENPFSYVSKELLTKSPKINITRQNFYAGIRVEDFFGGIVTNFSYFDYKATYESVKRNKQNKLVSEGFGYLDIDFCSKTYPSRESFVIGGNDFLCPDMFNITIGGDWNDESIEIVTLYIKTCDEETEKSRNIKCATKEELEERSSSYYFGARHHDVLIDPKNFSHPIVQSYVYDSFNLDLNLRKIYSASYSYNTIKTDTHLIINSEDKDPVSFLQLLKVKNEVKTKLSDNVILEFPLLISNIRVTTNRSYIKIQRVLSEIGGILTFSYFCLDKVLFFFIQNNLRYHLYNRLYKFYMYEPLEKSKKKSEDKENKQEKEKANENEFGHREDLPLHRSELKTIGKVLNDSQEKNGKNERDVKIPESDLKHDKSLPASDRNESSSFTDGVPVSSSFTENNDHQENNHENKSSIFSPNLKEVKDALAETEEKMISFSKQLKNENPIENNQKIFQIDLNELDSQKYFKKKSVTEDLKIKVGNNNTLATDNNFHESENNKLTHRKEIMELVSLKLPEQNLNNYEVNINKPPQPLRNPKRNSIIGTSKHKSLTISKITSKKELKPFTFTIKQLWCFQNFYLSKYFSCFRKSAAKNKNEAMKNQIYYNAKRDLDKKLDIVCLFKSLDNFNLLGKLLINKQQQFMLDNLNKKIICNEFPLEYSSFEEMETLLEQDNIDQLNDYLMDLFEKNELSKMDKELFKRLDENIKKFLDLKLIVMSTIDEEKGDLINDVEDLMVRLKNESVKQRLSFKNLPNKLPSNR